MTGKTAIWAVLLAAMTGGGMAFAVGAAETRKPYELVFREGTLDALDQKAVLVYDHTVSNTLNPDAASKYSGAVHLSLVKEDMLMAQLALHKDGKTRGMGEFPASVGNPIVMLFYETAARDMADSAGGSPFYIRNRIKEALSAEVPVTDAKTMLGDKEISTQSVTITPFAKDPNRDRMKGFEDLTLTVTMSPDVPGGYVELEAHAGDVYRSDFRFTRTEQGQ